MAHELALDAHGTEESAQAVVATRAHGRWDAVPDAHFHAHDACEQPHGNHKKGAECAREDEGPGGVIQRKLKQRTP